MTLSIEIIKPDDFHVHFRFGDMLRQVIASSGSVFKRVLPMPNVPLVDTAEKVVLYEREIHAAYPGIETVMSLYLRPHTTADMIEQAVKVGASVIKSMPRSRKVDAAEASTGAHYGLTPDEFEAKDEVFASVTEHGGSVSTHGEDPDHPLEHREKEFFPFAERIVRRHPNLRLVIEHVSSRAGVEFVKQHKNVYATITVPHLMLTWSDVVGNHDNLCMPVAKTEDDRLALLEVAMSGHPRFFFGSDSAPHPRQTKNRVCGSFGIYSAPVAMNLLVQIFEKHGKLDRLEDFVSKFGAEFYRLPQNKERIELYKEDWTVPDPIVGPHDPATTVRPFMAGQVLSWKVRT